jgi:hypothetical protein
MPGCASAAHHLLLVPNLQGHFSLIESVLSDQAWTAAGVLAGVVSALVALATLIVQVRKPPPKKSLSSRVELPFERRWNLKLSGRSRAAPKEAAPKDVLVRWTVTNDGTESIGEGDYRRPLALFFGEGAQPRAVKITRHTGLRPTVSVGRHRLIFVQQHLDAGDGFTVEAIVAGYAGRPRVEGHVIGVPQIIDATARRKARRVWQVAAPGVLACAVIVTFVALARDQPRSGVPRKGLGLTVRAWGLVGAEYRGQYELVLGVNAYANGTDVDDVRLARFRLLVSSFDAAHWAPPGARLAQGASQVDYRGKRVWAVPAAADGVSVLNPATGVRTVPSLWSARSLVRGQSYPARAPDGVMTFYLPRSDVHNNGALKRVIGLAYVSDVGRVLLVKTPHSWGPQRATDDV